MKKCVHRFNVQGSAFSKLQNLRNAEKINKNVER